jgi:hypothetical protein
MSTLAPRKARLIAAVSPAIPPPAIKTFMFKTPIALPLYGK